MQAVDVTLAELLFSEAQLFQLLHLLEFWCGTLARHSRDELWKQRWSRESGKRDAKS